MLPPPKGCCWLLLLNGVGDGAIGDEPNGIGDNPNGDGEPLVLPPMKFGATAGPTFDDPNGVIELITFPPPNGMLLRLLDDCPNGDVPDVGKLNVDGADDAPNGDGAGAPLPKGAAVV